MDKLPSASKPLSVPTTSAAQARSRQEASVIPNRPAQVATCTAREPGENREETSQFRKTMVTAEHPQAASIDLLAEQIDTTIDVMLDRLELLSNNVSNPYHLEHIHTAKQAGRSLLSMISTVCQMSHGDTGNITDHPNLDVRNPDPGDLPSAVSRPVARPKDQGTKRKLDSISSPIAPNIAAPISLPCHGDTVRVLLAEDLAACQQTITAMLARSGLTVVAVTDGYKAIEALNRSRYDLVLINVTLRGMDGLQTAAAIRQLPGAAALVPIIAMTTQTLSVDNEKFLDAGLDDYLCQPVTYDQLQTVIARWSVTPLVRVPGARTPGARERIPPEAEQGGNTNMDIKKPNEGDASLSIETLDQLARDTDPAIVPQLITVFLDDAKQRISRITDAIESRDYSIVAAEAHALGSSAATFGLPGIHTIARQCEYMMREENHKEGLKFAGELVANTRLGLEELSNYARSLH